MRLFPDKPDFEYLMDVHATLEAPDQIGAGPFGQRSIHTVSGGTFEGPKLKGTARAGGGDWLLTSPSHNELDVRVTLQTDDGANIYLSYRGVLKFDPALVGQIFGGADIDHPTAYYFRTAPRFETGHEQYAWLNSLVCVAYGYFGPQKVGYRVFAVK
jgi:hypothetical protein